MSCLLNGQLQEYCLVCSPLKKLTGPQASAPSRQRLLATTAGTTADTDVWQSFAYTYDNNANITRIVDATNANQVQCFTYDALDRLTSGFTDNTTTCNGHTPTGDGNYDETYTFNAAGDITSKTGQGTYTYNDPDHVHAVTSTSTGSVFTYNDDGDMVTRKTGNGPTQTLTWNMEERLETVTENGTTSTYLYAEDGSRTRTNTDNDYTYYHGNTEYRHNPDTGDQSWTYAHNFGGQTVAVTVDGDTSWLFADQIGSNSLAVTETGAVSVQRYTPWGETRVDGGLPTQRGYTGQIEDENTGLSYYNARYYDPTIGRFISPDTIIPNAANGQDYNRYAYVNNRPIIANDPTGHVCYTTGVNAGRCYDGADGEWDAMTSFEEKLTVHIGEADGGDDNLRFTMFGHVDSTTIVDNWRTAGSGMLSQEDQYINFLQQMVFDRDGTRYDPRKFLEDLADGSGQMSAGLGYLALGCLGATAFTAGVSSLCAGVAGAGSGAFGGVEIGLNLVLERPVGCDLGVTVATALVPTAGDLAIGAGETAIRAATALDTVNSGIMVGAGEAC